MQSSQAAVSRCFGLSLGQTKVKHFLPFSKLMKRPQIKFHAHTMKKSQAIESKKGKIYH